MYFLKIFNYKTLKYDLINKFKYKKTTKLPKFKNIILNINSNIVNLKQLLSKLLAIELISRQKGCVFSIKNSETIFKAYSKNLISCKLTLKNNNLFIFIGKLITKIFPKLKNISNYSFYFKTQKAYFLYYLKNIFIFSELENYYYFFNNLSELCLIITLNYYIEKKEFIFVLKSFKINFSYIINNLNKKKL